MKYLLLVMCIRLIRYGSIPLSLVSMSTQAILHHKHSLEVRFRPEDSYCKPAIAKETKVTAVDALQHYLQPVVGWWHVRLFLEFAIESVGVLTNDVKVSSCLLLPFPPPPPSLA